MTIFGQFGLRPSQTKHKCLAYFLDIWFLFSYIAVCVSSLLHLGVLFTVYQSELNKIFSLDSIVYVIIIVMTFTLWLFITFKEYDVFFLLEDVVSIRKTKLGKGEIFLITATISMVGTVFLTNGVLVIVTINWNMSSWYIFLNLFQSVYDNTTWMLMWNITFLMCVITLIISREYQKSITDLCIISEERYLCSGKLFEVSERFTELSSVVDKVDSMFSFPVGIILTMTLSSLCAAIYAVVVGENPIIWSMAVVYSALSLGFLLLSLSTLNYRVRNLSRIKNTNKKQVCKVCVVSCQTFWN